MTTMTFNGIDMSKYFRVTDIIRPIGNKISVSTDDAPSVGVNVQQVKIAEKEHTVKFDMKGSSPRELEVLKHELASVLNVSKPVKIIYDDEPDKYYLGMPVGDITPDNLARWFQRSELKLLIPDGVAHSLTYRKFDDGKEQGNKIVFDLDNQGSVNAQPIITVKHNSENGYIGLVNTTGILEVGDRQEVERRPSEILLDFQGKGWVEKALKQGVLNKAILNDKNDVMNYNLINNDTWGVDHLALAEEGAAGSGNKDATTRGASITWEIPADSDKNVGSLYEYIEWVEQFMIGHILQMGYIKISVSDENDKFLYGVETFKRVNGSDCEYNFLIADKNGGYQIFPNNFSSAEGNLENPFSREKGIAYISRRNEVVNFYFKGQLRPISAPAIKNKKSKKISIYFGEVGSAERVTFMYIERFLYRKDFGDYDSPNRYRMGSKVVLNSESDTIYVDKLIKNPDVVQGSNFITIPQGKSQLEIYCSSWIKKKPTVSVEFEERYL